MSLAIPQPAAGLDIEVLPNWYYMLAADRDGNAVFEHEVWSDGETRTEGKLPGDLITFNGSKYDLIIAAAIRQGRGPAFVKALSDEIILERGWPEFALRRHGIPPFVPDSHIDVHCMRNYGSAGLKLRAMRLHHPRLRLMPVDHEQPISKEQAPAVRAYCLEDVAALWTCYDDAGPMIETCAALPVPRPFETPPTSSGEIIWKRHATRDLAPDPVPTVLRTGFEDHCAELRAAQDTLIAFGPNMKSADVELHGLTVRVGSGGLHTQERALCVDNVLLADASSYYARLIIALNREHRSIPDLAGVYQTLLDQRLAAEGLSGGTKQDEAGKTTAKLLLASGTGKLHSEHSCMYDHGYYLSTTRSGASLMLDLAARIFHKGAAVYSMNTDGVVCDDTPAAGRACAEWAEATGIPLTYKACAKYRARDVSSYVATDYDGERIKLTGDFYSRSRNHNPNGPIIAEAACQAVLDCNDWQAAYSRIRAVVMGSQDVADFAIVRQSKSDMTFDGEPVGRLARVAVVRNGDKLTTGTRTIADCERVALLPDYDDFDISWIDRTWYVEKAIGLWERTHAKGSLL